MASRIRTIADEVTAALNTVTLPQTIPFRTPMFRTAVAPAIERDKTKGYGGFVIVTGHPLLQNSTPDRCGRQWQSQLTIVIINRFDRYDDILEQPATLDTVDQCIENSEAILEFLDQNRNLPTCNLVSLGMANLADDDWLRQQSLFFCQISAGYV